MEKVYYSGTYFPKLLGCTAFQIFKSLFLVFAGCIYSISSHFILLHYNLSHFHVFALASIFEHC